MANAQQRKQAIAKASAEVRSRRSGFTRRTQQQFDLSSFRKEVEARATAAREKAGRASRRGWADEELLEDAVADALQGVLALLPAEEETETPTQEVERFVISTGTNGVCRPAPDGAFVKFEDHQRLLRAEEEKRLEIGGKFEELCDQRWEEGCDWCEERRLDAVAGKEAAESQLEEVAQELEARVEAAEELRGKAHRDRDAVGAAIHAEAATANREALKLLRDKGTEQGGGCRSGEKVQVRPGTAGAAAGEHHCEVCELGQELADARRELQEIEARLGDSGVAIEGGPGLLDQALAALDEIASRPTSQRNPDGDDQAAEAMALLAREHAGRIRGLQGERGEG